jgi:Protein of unknown function (DUF2892).
MQANVGSADKTIRIVVGIAVIAAGVMYQNWWGAVGLVPLATALMGWCPPYSLLGINTCSLKKNG